MANLSLTPSSLVSNVQAGIDLLTSFFKRDIVGVFDQNSLQQVFTDARPIQADIRETSRVMEYPVETGVTLSDHHIILPTEIEMMMSIKSEFYTSAYEQIRSAFINATLLSVQMKARVYPNMIIRELPHTEQPDKFDQIVLYLKMKEVLFVAPSSIAPQNLPADFVPADPVDATTVTRGQQTPTALTADQTAAIQAQLAKDAPQ